MFGQQTVPQSSNGRVGLRQKYAMKKALKQKQSVATAQPVSTGRKHYIRKHKNVAVGKPSIFQRIKMFISKRSLFESH